MSDIFNYAVSQVNRSRKAFCRFITANDVNLTSHQTGFYVPKEAESLLFDVPGERGSNKDRWRQVLNEADRIGTKYLFTLQPSISANQLQEMKHERVVLVIPEDNRNSFDDRYRSDLLSLKQFISIVKEKQNRHCV